MKNIKNYLIFTIFLFLACLTSCGTETNNLNISGITIDQLPIKTVYKVNESLDLKGLEVIQNSNEYTLVAIDDLILIKPDMSTAGAKEVIVRYRYNYHSYEAKFNISVEEYTIEETWSTNEDGMLV